MHHLLVVQKYTRTLFLGSSFIISSRPHTKVSSAAKSITNLENNHRCFLALSQTYRVNGSIVFITQIESLIMRITLDSWNGLFFFPSQKLHKTSMVPPFSIAFLSPGRRAFKRVIFFSFLQKLIAFWSFSESVHEPKTCHHEGLECYTHFPFNYRDYRKSLI